MTTGRSGPRRIALTGGIATGKSHVRAEFERSLETRDIGRAKTLFFGTVQNMNTACMTAFEFIGKRTCAIGGIIIHNQNLQFSNLKRQQRLYH